MSEHLYPQESSSAFAARLHIEDINEALLSVDPTLAGFPRDVAIRRLGAERDRYRSILVEAMRVACGRPHDGSQLDEDLEGLLLSCRNALEGR